MNLIKYLFIGLAMLTLSACASPTGKAPFNPLGQKVAESVIDVSEANRDLKICWMAAGAIEVMTDLAQKGGNAQVALGSISLLQGAIDKARNHDPFWAETDSADVTLLFANVLKDVGRSRLSQMLLGGPSIGTFLNVAKRTIILTIKGHAVLKDINNVLIGVEFGTITKADAWKACENRTAMNRNSLRMMLGLTVSSMEKQLGTQTVELGFLYPNGLISGGGWLSAKWWPLGSTSFFLLDGPFDWLTYKGDALFLKDTIMIGEGYGGINGWPPGNTSFVSLRGTDFVDVDRVGGTDQIDGRPIG